MKLSQFAVRVLSVVRRIPPGRVATYGDVAALAGRPRASRAVGNIMRGCRDRGVPAHRVIAAGGALGGFGGNLELKKALLRAEGILVPGRRIRQFSRVRWPPSPRLRRAKALR
ncbi:MAG: MGMT family protein [Acidobacteria bacterium]|nr:MAG: MGMT family protein [Acidobacteriota bacterium]